MHHVQTDREVDGRWIAEVADLPGVPAYGATQDGAVRRVHILTLRVLSERRVTNVDDPFSAGPEGRPPIVAGPPGRR